MPIPADTPPMFMHFSGSADSWSVTVDGEGGFSATGLTMAEVLNLLASKGLRQT